jgi:aryl-alcohol dehydrogenase-like predicted oxidoreductase
MELLYTIADTSHGARGAFVRKLARQKHVTETAIWNHISDIEKCVSDARMTTKRIDSMQSQYATLNRAFDEAKRDHDVAISLLSRSTKAQKGFGKLDFEAAAYIRKKLQSIDISISDHTDIVQALEEIAEADENAVFSLKPKTSSPANPM